MLAGDLNSDPRGGAFPAAAFDILTAPATGLHDTGNQANTCCQDADLLNPTSQL